MINRVILMGRLTADPELKQTPSNISACSFNIAVTRNFKDSEGNYGADFIRIQTWRQTAEFVNRYFAKGKMIAVEGRLQNNDYTDKNGVKRYQMVVVADNVAFCGDSKGDGSGGAGTAQTRQTGQAGHNTNNDQSAVDLGDLGDFTEILSDGEVPF